MNLHNIYISQQSKTAVMVLYFLKTLGTFNLAGIFFCLLYELSGVIDYPWWVVGVYLITTTYLTYEWTKFRHKVVNSPNVLSGTVQPIRRVTLWSSIIVYWLVCVLITYFWVYTLLTVSILLITPLADSYYRKRIAQANPHLKSWEITDL